MYALEFSTNWNNKLDCNCFTTIRIYNPTKHFKGNEFDIYLKKKFRAKAVVLEVIFIKLKQLSDYACYLDTGYNSEETINLFKKMYPKIDFEIQPVCVLLLKKLEPPQLIQSRLFEPKQPNTG
jgi:hypothetical protein